VSHHTRQPDEIPVVSVGVAAHGLDCFELLRAQGWGSSHITICRDWDKRRPLKNQTVRRDRVAEVSHVGTEDDTEDPQEGA
jgi:hypothetical protein